MMQPIFSTLDRFAELSILVVGDAMLDRYLQGSVSRISPEAPVPVVRRQREWATPGGAGHVAASIAGLGCRVALAALVGADPSADELARTLQHAGVHQLHLLAVPGVNTVTKTRIVAGDFQQLLRVDEDPLPGEWADAPERLAQSLLSELHKFDAVVLTDYEKGVLTDRVLRVLIDAARSLGKPVIVDPKKADLRVYSGATILTPNSLETERAIGRRLGGDDDAASVAAQLREDCSVETMLVTRGAHGMTGCDSQGAFHIPAQVREVADVTGAGDTVVSVIAACLGAGVGVRMACDLASRAAGVAVSHPGTYVVSVEEIRASFVGHAGKILSPSGARRRAAAVQARGGRVGFTNGCFDLLHAGHLYSLQEARKRSDFLVVGLNSDDSVRQLKGPSRPIIGQNERAAMLAALECVDAVVLFSEETPAELIATVQPDLILKGGDHVTASIIGGDVVRARGGEVISLPRIDGLSTTEIIARLLSTQTPTRRAG